MALKEANLSIRSSETLPVRFHLGIGLADAVSGGDPPPLSAIGVNVPTGVEVLVPPAGLGVPVLDNGLVPEAAGALGGGGG